MLNLQASREALFCLYGKTRKMAIKFSVDKQEQYSIVTVDEEKLNSLNAPELKSEFVVLNNEGTSNIILDLSNVSFVDSSGLSAILIGNRLCSNDDGSFVLSNVQENVLKLIKISQLDSILNIAPTQEEAKDLVVMDKLEKDIEGEKDSADW